MCIQYLCLICDRPLTGNGFFQNCSFNPNARPPWLQEWISQPQCSQPFYRYAEICHVICHQFKLQAQAEIQQRLGIADVVDRLDGIVEWQRSPYSTLSEQEMEIPETRFLLLGQPPQNVQRGLQVDPVRVPRHQYGQMQTPNIGGSQYGQSQTPDIGGSQYAQGQTPNIGGSQYAQGLANMNHNPWGFDRTPNMGGSQYGQGLTPHMGGSRNAQGLTANNPWGLDRRPNINNPPYGQNLAPNVNTYPDGQPIPAADQELIDWANEEANQPLFYEGP